MKDVILHVGATSIEFQCDEFGNVAPGINIAPFIREHLQVKDWVQEWSPQIQGMKRYQVTENYTYRNKHTGMAYIPRHFLDLFVRFIGEDRVVYQDRPPYPAKTVSMKMKRRFKLKDEQIPVMDFLMEDGSMKPVNVPVGQGKTIMAIDALCRYMKVAMIVLPGLIGQWTKAIKQFTTLTNKDLYLIKGFDSLKALWGLIAKNRTPKIILASMRTLSMYALDYNDPYNTLPNYQEFQKQLGIGTYIADEVHMWFYTNVRLQLLTNVERNIFLSATYARTDTTENKIFNMIFPADARYIGEAKKYTNVTFYSYKLGIPMKDIARFTIQNIGYSHARYENFLMKYPKYYDHWLDTVVIPAIKMHYVDIKNEGEKCLILCWTRELVKKITNDLMTEFPGLKVGKYFSGQISDDVLTQLDIIVSTNKSCGVGRDIKGLRMCLNTVSFASDPLSTQVMGRLRQIPDVTTEYVDIYNNEVAAQCWHARKRATAYKRSCKGFKEHQINY